MNKKIWIGVGVVVLVGIAFYLLHGGDKSIYTSDTTIRGNYSIAHDKHIVLKNNARLSVDGDMTVDGTLSCDSGSLSFVVLGKLTVNGRLQCVLEANSNSTPANMALRITAKHIEFSKESEVAANGHVIIVSDANDALESEQSIERAFNETGEDTGEGARIGPFTPSNPTRKITTSTGEAVEKADTEFILRGKWHIGDGAQLAGDLSAPTLANNIPFNLFYVNTGVRGALRMDNLTFSLPLGSNGSDDLGSSCKTKGAPGALGARFRAIAGHMSITNTSIHLASGGSGGNAETGSDCASAEAVGGDGGGAGNIKLTAATSIVVDDLNIIPGKGGNGGNARAIARNGIDACPGSLGANATGVAGNGSDNRASLAVAGVVSSVNNIRVGRVDGGIGGRAFAQGGNGGNGNACGCAGGDGGNASAKAGDGGDTLVALPHGTAEAHGGDGGDTTARAGSGGSGGNCADTSGVGKVEQGGTGGRGGKGNASAGKGGMGTTAKGDNGRTVDRRGGVGGSGGDACVAGQGGTGGIGFPVGDNGRAGIALCVSTTTTALPTTIPMIKAILFHNKYLPTDQLMVAELAGCGESYWHSVSGTVIATDDSVVTDTLLACDFGKVRETAVIDTLGQMATVTPIIFEGR